MTERLRRLPRHPIAKRYPAEPPPRIQISYRKGDYDHHGGLYNDEEAPVCDCFPRPSRHTIPSMFYDKIVCPHKDQAHVQPAHVAQFNYPWTANSTGRPKLDEEDTISERMSLISEEDEQLRFTPNFLQRNPPDVLSVATAPPYWYTRKTNPREEEAPYTAPANDEPVLAPRGRRAVSVQDLHMTGARTPKATSQRQPSPERLVRGSRLSNRQFTGNYVDPKDGKVYQYNVNYDGSPVPKGNRQPVNSTKKPTTAL